MTMGLSHVDVQHSSGCPSIMGMCTVLAGDMLVYMSRFWVEKGARKHQEEFEGIATKSGLRNPPMQNMLWAYPVELITADSTSHRDKTITG